jgi:hypothetical protein
MIFLAPSPAISTTKELFAISVEVSIYTLTVLRIAIQTHLT